MYEDYNIRKEIGYGFSDYAKMFFRDKGVGGRDGYMARFEGRLSRKGYALFFAIQFICLVLMFIVVPEDSLFEKLAAAFISVYFFPFKARRFHDMGYSTAYLVFFEVLLCVLYSCSRFSGLWNALFYGAIMVVPSEKGCNRYGPVVTDSGSYKMKVVNNKRIFEKVG